MRKEYFMTKCTAVLAGVAMALALAGSVASPAVAQTAWPMEKPVTLIWPFGAGGDLAGRVIAEALSAKYGQQFLIDNRPGASGTTGTAVAAQAAPDGYTLVFAFPGPAANNKNTFASMPYDPLVAFDYISQVTDGNMVLVGRTELAANTLPELVDYARANPEQVTVGALGQGSYGQLVALALATQEDIAFSFVPYTGAGDITTDHLSQSLDISINAISASYQALVLDGQIKALGVASEQRMPGLPDVPTFKEQGIDLVVQPWIGLMGPKGLPPEMISELQATLNDILTNDQDVIAKLAEAGQPAHPSTSDEFAKLVQDEYAKWQPIIEEYGIRVE